MPEGDHLHDRVSRRVTDALDPWSCQALIATLDTSLSDVSRPPSLWHWVYFRDSPPTAQLGSDGHPGVPSLLPRDLPPRRMFAGAEVQFHQPLQFHQPATLTESIEDVAEKSGSSGRLVFVRLALDYRQGDALCISERRTIVYRDVPGSGPGSDAPTPGPPEPVLQSGPIHKDCTMSETTLFRYSALTFNTHRIHYDRPYAMDVEFYPGLVVHGPLLATLLADAGRQALGADLSRFAFRARAPIFANESFHIRGQVSGDQATLYAYRADGKIAVEATAQAGQG
jgi:3-methylfumaryl-CoA hydratase